MAAKQNCWEFTRCGRQPGGSRTRELGVCPVATESRYDGVHGGKQGGRACWAVAGTLCKGKVQGTFALKLANCLKCDFFLAVSKEEGRQLQPATELLKLANR